MRIAEQCGLMNTPGNEGVERVVLAIACIAKIRRKADREEASSAGVDSEKCKSDNCI